MATKKDTKAKKDSKSKATSTSKTSSTSKNVGVNGTNIGKVDQAQAAQIGEVKKGNVVELGKVDPVVAAQAAQAREIEASKIDTAAQEQFRQKQLDLATALEAQSRGEGPSLASMQMDKANQQNINTQFALARSGRAGNPALGMKTAMGNAAILGQGNAFDSALARIQEQNQARALLSSVTDLGRLRDIGLATSQAELNQNANLANQSAYNQNQQFNAAEQNKVGIANADIQKALVIAQGQMAQGVEDNFVTAFNNALAKQAELNQQAALQNSAAINQARAEQARINQAIKSSQIAAAATTGAASIGAGASRYATDADLYKFNMGLANNIDNSAYNNTTTSTNAQYDAQRKLEEERRKREEERSRQINEAGKATAGMGSGGSGSSSSSSAG